MKKEDKAISQIVGAALLLLIALAILSTVYMYVLSYPLPNPAPYVDIVGSIEGGNIVLTHRGGEALDFNTEVRLMIGGIPKSITVGDGDYLDNESKENGQWDIGEQLVYTPTEDITNLQVKAIVIDSLAESILMTGIIQEGIIIANSDTFKFDNVRCYEPDIIHVSGKIYAIAYRGESDDGYLKTVEIADNGDITDTVIDTLEFDTDKCYEPNIIHVSGNIYAIAYQGESDDGYLKTVEIADNGDINVAVKDSLEFDIKNGYEPNIIHVSGNIYAIAYGGDKDDGYLKTVEIADNGDITDTVIDTLEFDTDKCYESNIIHVSGNIYAIAYQGENGDGFLKTVEIADNGNINDTVVDSFEFDTDQGYEPNIIHVSGNIYAIAYQGENDDAFLKTVQIADNGDINDTAIDNFEFDTDKGYEFNIIHVSGNIFAITYRSENNLDFLLTEEIADNGNITDTIIDNAAFEADKGYEPDIIRVSGTTVYAIAYRGPNTHGFVKTVQIVDNGDIID